ncbi:hypothetical protein N9L68_06655 [bacterium]|nr:hypothetical protein [bacterium]
MSVHPAVTGEHITLLIVSGDGLAFNFNREDVRGLEDGEEMKALIMRYRWPIIQGRLGMAILKGYPMGPEGLAHGRWLDDLTTHWKTGCTMPTTCDSPTNLRDIIS